MLQDGSEGVADVDEEEEEEWLPVKQQLQLGKPICTRVLVR